MLSASCGPVTIKSSSAGRWAPAQWWLQLDNLVIASGPHLQFALGPSTCMLPSYLRVLAFSPSSPHCGWPGCSPSPGSLSSHYPHAGTIFTSKTSPNAESAPDSQVTFPHLISLLFYSFHLDHSLSVYEGLGFTFSPDFII